MATTKQTHMIAGRMVEFQEKFSSLSNNDAQYVIQNAGEAIDLFIGAIVNHSKSTAKAAGTLLGAIVTTFIVPATTEKFVAKDKFKVDTSEEAQVKICFLGDDFKKCFLSKIEDSFAGSTISGRKLEKNAVDGHILAELGGNEAAETTLAEMWAAMEAEPNGKDGDLLNNDGFNIFYITDIDGTLRAVGVDWRGGGWRVGARSVGDTLYVGGQVFSRKPQTN